MPATESTALQRDVGENGLPAGTEEAFNPMKAMATVAVFMTVPRIIGLAIGFAVYGWGSTPKYDAKIEMIKDNDLAYLYAGVFFFSVMVSCLNMFPTYYKSKIMKFDSGNLRANMQIYKVNYADVNKAMPYVVMEEEGSVGQYNRANRSLHHFNENAAGFMLCLLLAGYVFTFPTFIMILMFIAGRILHQLGYAGGYGGHAPGFMLSMIASVVLESLVLIVAFKAA
mmetsp:Transcript_101222/g.179792  ORF Transcript_101222/g.179792 Transcript_101222/m.179792 type:complete len:226 (-) Transcript_101222:169-846(-)|eukprot:CAMPEP_0197653102 /NCGR_PEP_ID=MMETSP1338-20131121/34851_1 /TAXON_ID=43686 ORGANISM="Pelagodinium beii, Strain RCC1491" /NCGR_SAMPLE_ID=MMETSP1338 /ASSEMBLY_ACC=CAM_ASM_000754 /LENGTH=225 /DNA_ID=CAMNT_0043228111 /DNA_START=71 /DNA_END=748 /DNA_ORIENTATION=-